MFKSLLTLFALLFVLSDVVAGQDPTRPLSGKGVATISSNVEGADGNLVLQSIINASDKQKIKAIISGKLVANGDMVSHYKVISIEGKTVTLQSSEHTKKLVLFVKPIVNYK